MRVFIINIAGHTDQLLIHVETDDNLPAEAVKEKYHKVLKEAWPEWDGSFTIAEVDRADKKEWIPGLPASWIFPDLDERFTRKLEWI